MSDTDSVTENSEEIKTLDDQYDELSSKIDDLFIGDLGITTIYDGFEKARVKNKLKRLNKDPLIKKTLELVDLLYQSKQFLRDWKDRPTGDSGTAKVMDYDASNIDMDAWGEELMTKIGDKVSTKVEEIIPEVIKDAVDQISQSKKFTKPWIDQFRKSQSEFKDEANKVFKESLSETLTKHQFEAISTLSSKHQIEEMEIKKRKRNIVIGSIPEAHSDIATAERIDHDRSFVKKICKIDDEQLLKCFRAGKRNEDGTPRLVIATVISPDLANQLHRFGNGQKVVLERKLWWVNPDLTQYERHANFRAREFKRARQKTNNQSTL